MGDPDCFTIWQPADLARLPAAPGVLPLSGGASAWPFSGRSLEALCRTRRACGYCKNSPSGQHCSSLCSLALARTPPMVIWTAHCGPPGWAHNWRMWGSAPPWRRSQGGKPERQGPPSWILPRQDQGTERPGRPSDRRWEGACFSLCWLSTPGHHWHQGTTGRGWNGPCQDQEPPPLWLSRALALHSGPPDPLATLALRTC